jgi:hypothetical protein
MTKKQALPVITEILLNVTLKTITPPFYIVSGIA